MEKLEKIISHYKKEWKNLTDEEKLLVWGHLDFAQKNYLCISPALSSQFIDTIWDGLHEHHRRYICRHQILQEQLIERIWDVSSYPIKAADSPRHL